MGGSCIPNLGRNGTVNMPSRIDQPGRLNAPNAPIPVPQLNRFGP